MDGVATHIDHLNEVPVLFVPVSTEVSNAATTDCRELQFTEIIQEGIAHSSDGISQRLPTCLCSCVRVVRACVCVLCLSVCLSVYLSVSVCMCNRIYKCGIHFVILMRKL